MIKFCLKRNTKLQKKKKKKKKISTKPFSLYYEPWYIGNNLWHIQSTEVFKSLMVLISLSNKLQCLMEFVPGHNYILLNVSS